MLSTITERGSGSPVRIHSPRRIPIASRTYGTPTYTPRPVNINTADIDVSKDRYRHKVEPSTPFKATPSPPRKDSNAESENSPFMPRVDGKPETGIDSSPGVQRGTIKRGRTVVRLYTIKRNSPRKPTEESETSNTSQEQETEQNVEDTKTDEKEFMKWREKLSDDLAYKDKKEKKTMGAKLVEKFKVKDDNDKDSVLPTKIQSKETESSQSLPTTPATNINLTENKILDRRCSMELLAEQANLLDSLIRSENLSTATLDLSKVGIVTEPKNNIETFGSIKRRKPDNNPLKTTKSDHSLHDSLKSFKDVSDPRNILKRRSIRKSSSGSNILHRLDSITEFPKELTNVDLPAIEENKLPELQDNIKPTPKPKLKTKITSSVEISAPLSPLKFRVENVTVEEKPRIPRKEITYSSEVEKPTSSKLLEKVAEKSKDINNVKKKTNKKNTGNDLASPEPEDGNFWDKIGKRETIYLVKRKQNLDEAKQKHKRSLFWFPEEDEVGNGEELKLNNISKSETTLDTGVCLGDTKDHKTMDIDAQISKASSNKNEGVNTDHRAHNLASLIQNEFPEKQKSEILEQKSLEIKLDPKMNNENGCLVENVTNVIPKSDLTSEVKDSSELFKENKVDTEKSLSKVTIISQDCKNIGKSSSLDAIDEVKVKKSSQKKTKSEKSKKILKSIDNAELKSLPFLLPKPGKKTEVLEKLESKNNVQIVQNEITLVNESKGIICKPVPEPPKKEVELAVFLESNPSEKNTPMEDTHNDFPEKRLEENNLYKSIVEKEDDKAPKTKANTLLQSSQLPTSSIKTHTSLKTTEQNIETADLSEFKGIGVIENDKIPKKSTPKSTYNKSVDNTSEAVKDDKTVLDTSSTLSESMAQSTSKVTNISSINDVKKLNNSKIPNSSKNLTVICSPEAKSKPSTPAKLTNVVTKSEKTDDKSLKATIVPLKSEEPPSSIKTCNICSKKAANVPSDGSVATLNQTKANINTNTTDQSLHELTIAVPDIPIVTESQDIPSKDIESITELTVQTEQKTEEENKAENIIKKDDLPETSKDGVVKPPEIVSPKRPIKEEKAVKPLIATPRPLQKKPPQVIHSSDSSDSSSEEESSDDDDEDDSDDSEESAEFLECENNPDGRTSTGSNDSGFDSSAPTSPATFSQIRKGK